MAGGALEAFSAGMNNVANAVGPLVGAGMMSVSTGVWVGGLFVAMGAFVLGGKVLETNGKKITRLSLLQGSAVSFTSGTLVVIASLFGISPGEEYNSRSGGRNLNGGDDAFLSNAYARAV